MDFSFFKYLVTKSSVLSPVKFFYVLGFIIIFQFSTVSAFAQCAPGTQPAVLKTFGSGTDEFSDSEPSDYRFSTSYTQEFGTVNDAPQDGLFSFVNAVPDPWNVWHEGATDHTGDPNGYMMLVNASYDPGEFYRDTIRGLCTGIDYEFSSWMANVDVDPGRIEPNIRFEIRDATDGTLIEEYETGDMPISPTLTWERHAVTFNTDAEDVVLLLINNNIGGSGNDLVLDDIGFTPCLPIYEATGPDSLCEGEDFTFEVQPDGASFSNPVYQWQQKSGGSWEDLPAETATTLSRTNISPADSGWYRVIVSEAGNTDSPLCSARDSLHLSLKTNSISDPGSIAANQTICYNTAPDPFTSGGDAVSLLPVTYSWERSEDESSWETLTGSSADYTETERLTTTTYYRRKATTSCTSAYSDTITIDILPELDPGEIADDQMICDSVPELFTETTAASGGDGNYGYQWETSTDSATWTEITGAQSETYQSPAITEDRWFRRRVNDGQCATVVTEDTSIQDRVRYTNAVKVTLQHTPKPQADDVEQCQYSPSTTLTADGSNLMWYNTPVGGTGAATAPSYNTNTADTLRFYVSQQLSCESPRDTLSIIIHPKPVLDVSDTAICAGHAALLNFQTTNASGEIQYTWDPLSSLTITDENTVEAAPETTTDYNLFVEDSAACRDTATITVTVNDSPEINLPDVDLCAGEETLLTAATTGGTGAMSYQWTPTTGIISNTNNQAEVKPEVTTDYKVVVTDANQCKDSVTNTVTVHSKPELSTTDVTLCEGENTLLDFETAQATGAVNYTWSPTTNLTIQDQNTVRVTAVSDISYTLYAEDSQGCKDTATLNITTHPEVTANVPSVDLCAEQDTVLNATGTGGSGTLSYNWLPADGLQSVNGEEALVEPVTTTDYVVVISDVNNCRDTATGTVTVFPKPQLSVEGGDVCSGNPAELTSNVTNYTGAINYDWSPATGLNSTTASSVISTATTDTEYSLVVTDSQGCRDTMSTQVGVTTMPVAQILQDDTLLCKNDQIQLSAFDDPGENYSYTWYRENANGDNEQVSGQQHFMTGEAGIYTVEVRNNNSCPTLSAPVVIEVEDVTVEARASENEIYEGDMVELSALGSNSVKEYTWQTPEGQRTGSSFVTGLQATYRFLVEVTGEQCTADDTVTVVVLPSIIIPNGFSPDLDGKNDAWFIKGLSEYPNAQIMIYNRWGSVVYRYNSGYDKPWDGTNTQGEALPLGTYYYVIDVNDKKQQVFKGSVTIIK